MARNNTIRNVVGIAGVAIALGGVLWGFARGSGKIDQNVVEIIEVKEQVKAVDKKATANKETLIKLTTNMEHMAEIKDEMKEGFDRLEKAIKNEQ